MSNQNDYFKKLKAHPKTTDEQITNLGILFAEKKDWFNGSKTTEEKQTLLELFDTQLKYFINLLEEEKYKNYQPDDSKNQEKSRLTIDLSYIHFPLFNIQDYFKEKLNKTIYFSNCVFYFSDFFTQTFDGICRFENSHFRDIVNFRGAIFNEKVFFNNCTFEQDVRFLEATFNNEVSFNNVTVKKTIDLSRVHFEEFFDASGMSFNKIDLEGTHFQDPLLLGLSACENGHQMPLEPKHFANKESARLIKDHFEKQNNITEANKYFRIEQEKHIEALKREETKEHNKLGALITLYLNKYVSNFGIDWFRGLLTLSLFGYVVLFFYMALRYSPLNYPNQFYMAGDWHNSNLSATLFSFIVIAILYTINLKYIRIQEKLSNLKRYSVVKRYKKIFWLLRITRNIISNIVRYKIILSIVAIICVLSCLSKNDTTNLITQLLNFLNAFKDVDTYKGYETFGAIVRIISATIIYQIIVAFRQNTRRK